MSRRPPSVVAVEEPEPLAAVEEDAVEEDGDEDEVDAEDLPEIDADDDGDVGPVIVRD